MKKLPFVPMLAVLVVGGLLLPDIVVAQSLEEIVVTARKREENLMEVPLAITAFSAEELEARDIKQLGDIQLYTPSFSFTNMQGGSARNDRSSNALVFRGLTLNLNTGITAGGQLFIDGAPVIGAFSPSVVDTERVEVLKGPQSSYFGRSTFVGAINFVMKEPGDEFGAKVSVGAERFGSHEVHVSVEGPLVENKLSGRISFRDWEQGAYVDNNFTGENNAFGERTTQSFSTSLVWTPTDSVKVKAFLNYFEDEDGPGAQFALKQESFNGRGNANGGCDALTDPLPPGADPADRWTRGYVCGTLPSVGDVSSAVFSADTVIDSILQETLFNPPAIWTIFDPSWHTDAGLRREAFQGNVRVDWDFGGGYTLTSLTAVHRDKNQNIIDLNYRNGMNVPNTGFGFCAFVLASPAQCRMDWNNTLAIQGEQEDWSQEVRLTSPQEGRFRWTAGFNYFDAHSPGGSVYGNIAPLGPFFTSAIVERDVETPAVFGAVYYDITDKLTLTAEGRYQRDKITEDTKLGTNQQPPNPPLVLTETFNSFAPRVSLDYKYADNSTAYVLFSRGFRPGRFNSVLATADQPTLDALRAVCPQCELSVEEEQLDNWEFGVKSTWLDGRARTTVAVYFDEWIDGQVGNSIPVVANGTANLINVVLNNGSADLWGIEFEGSILATENLTLGGSFGLNDTEINEFVCGDCNLVYGSFDGVVGNELPGAPRIAYSLYAMYQGQVGLGGFGTWDWFGRVDWAHQGSRFVDYSNVAKTAAYDDVSLRFGIRNENLTVEAYVLNALDHDEFIAGFLGIDVFSFTGFGGPDRNEIRVGAPIPQRFGMRATYRF